MSHAIIGYRRDLDRLRKSMSNRVLESGILEELLDIFMCDILPSPGMHNSRLLENPVENHPENSSESWDRAVAKV